MEIKCKWIERNIVFVQGGEKQDGWFLVTPGLHKKVRPKSFIFE